MLKSADLNNNRRRKNLRPCYLTAYSSVIQNLQLQVYKLPALDWKNLGCGSAVASWSTPESTFTTVAGVPRQNLGAAAFLVVLSACFPG